MGKISREKLKELFRYKDGKLYDYKDKPFGSYCKDGYLQGILFGVSYKLHRLIWLYHKGEFPKGSLDHINGVRDDNRIENLRECTPQQNSFNKKSINKTSNYKGVCWNKNEKKWTAQYYCDGKKIFLGYFLEETLAAKAYDKAVKELHGEFRRLNYG